MPKSKPAKKTSDYSFEDLNRDLVQLDQLLSASHVKPRDRLAMLRPITAKMPGKPVGYWLMRLVPLMMIIAMVWMKRETLDWHASALGRIGLIKLLPYFDWRYLKSQTCLIPKVALVAPKEIFDCNLCESLEEFRDFELQSEEGGADLVEKLVEIDRPVLVSGEIQHWIPDSPAAFISQLLKRAEFRKSVPCQLESSFHNDRLGDPDLATLFRKRQLFQSFFLHFQNCDPSAVRAFRNFTARPQVLPAALAPVAYSWMLWNSRYSTLRYKKINLIEKIALIGQLVGSTRLRLVPRKNCQEVCPIINGVLSAGHVLILTSLWDVEYCPGGDSENMAAILEVKG
ncbi:uncharacterized protein LOC109540097 [Dendroctonus ponderosae]|uniref:Uncharacterized protein n=1 Tax=Dendroctonus ponderosae TaxID=77166 RepID=U4UAE9_DENPD|nr:uncharacterized protein LOC109540097 [Dendroctonus ponderosae]XP_019763855.2 uncharacterized protein LOC109540097 [Dendroctonus ponderosae]XP_019763856.2 uncharacterized protein LOC109540097 [Dendroctonus ponderosae]ERL86925.1 hypothetical protein D910_04328 [Dendroctonus ponderosae]KAH1018075.1 hypothetical protein HUJ05_005897 [Dendroctonus ponderosae]